MILPSNSAQWSHPHLEPKKEKEVYRICCDFKNLNRATKKYTWPLPNIQSMLQRIGAHRPKYFAVLDLTSGYHQIPISVNSQDYTSFRT